MNNFTILSLLLLFGLECLAVNFDKVKSYHKYDYDAHSKNWSIVSDNNGYLYCANHKGILQYDGCDWKLYELPNSGVLRSVFINSEGVLYSGSFEDFGYWKRDQFGKLFYTSLKHLISEFAFHNQEIWKIEELDGAMYFHSFDAIFYYDGKEVSIIRNLAAPSFIMNINKRIVTQLKTGKLIGINRGLIGVLNNSKIISGAELKTSVKLNEKQHLIGSGFKGAFIMEGDDISIWKGEANHTLKTTQINKILLKGDRLFFATNEQGLFITSREGIILEHLDATSGLVSNSIQDMCLDNSNHLWLAQNGGISQVDLAPVFHAATQENSCVGAVYSAAIFNGKLYIGTDIGVFHHPYNVDNLEFKLEDFILIPELTGQSWALKCFDKQLFCGHSKGTFLIGENQIKQISDTEGGFCLYPKRINGKDYVFQGTYSGIVRFVKEDNVWRFDRKINNFTEPTNHLEIDYLGNIWTTHYAKNGIFRLEVSKDLNSIDSIEFYTPDDISTSQNKSANLGLATLGGRVVFLTNQGLYTYDDLEQQFKPLTNKDEQSDELVNLRSIRPVANGHYLFVFDNKIDLKEYSSSTFETELSFHFPKSLFVEDSEEIIALGNGAFLTCLENGFAILNQTSIKNNIPQELKLKFRKIELKEGKDLLPLDNTQVPQIQYKDNFIRFHIGEDNLSGKALLSYKLDGLDEPWESAVLNKAFSYSRLPWGKYCFRVRGKDSLGNEADEISYHFRVAPPYYASIGAIAFYITIFLVSIFLIIRYNRHSISRERKQSLTRILELENQNLKDEVKYKSKELAATTQSAIRKNKALTEVKKILVKQKDDIPKKSFDVLSMSISQRMSREEDLDLFEEHFDKAYNNFFKRLKSQYPQLSSSDMRLCSYLRMNLTTKEIASLMGISVRGIETHRYRLRQKLNLASNDNLIEFILNQA